MESKRNTSRTCGTRGTNLLIEPVWNRNLIDFFFCHVKKNLLIEPVWNRNFDDDEAFEDRIEELLIEPVWNRNTV